ELARRPAVGARDRDPESVRLLGALLGALLGGGLLVEERLQVLRVLLLEAVESAEDVLGVELNGGLADLERRRARRRRSGRRRRRRLGLGGAGEEHALHE